MKLIVGVLFAFLAISAFAEEEAEWVEIDWANVVPMTELPGFWDGREIKMIPDVNVRAGRIVGGTVAAPNSVPFQAGLLMTTTRGTGLCGGSAISNRVILTAAHCPIGTLSTQVILGAHQITANEATQQRRTVQPSGYRIHASYNPNNFNNDVATLILPTTVTATPQVQWAALPALGNTETFAGLTGTATGWGRVSDTSTATSPTLRTVDVPVITNAVCSQSLGGIIASTICTGGAGGRGTCNGDSGGPLTILRSGARLQVGLTSFGPARCQAGSPSAYARITSFRQWIINNSS
jgi:secreted trypsin-like serine protease